jgi:hypothetical protein
MLPRSFTDTVLSTAKERINNIVPTTYEASKAYLNKEILKPEGQRDLHREMCMLVVMAIPKNEEILLKFEVLKVLVPLSKGE